MKRPNLIYILGIESSCDETAAAVLKIVNEKFSILSNIISSQIKIHQKFGGVVPEVAARNHIKNILPVIDEALKAAKIKPSKIGKIGVVYGPGLITSLMVGVETAKTLSWVWQKPLVPVNHLKAHIYANFINHQPKKGREPLGSLRSPEGDSPTKITFPAIALVVSGGHTELILMKNKKHFKKIGQTLDDAAGESFDKVAKLLKIGYPGGPIISKLAQRGNPNAFNLPRPMLKSPDFNFSFSGLKTAVLYTVKKFPSRSGSARLAAKRALGGKADVCASFQRAVVEVLVAKTLTAGQKYRAKTLILGGGVAANQELRKQLQFAISHKLYAVRFLVPEISLCTDNAAMVAVAANFAKPIPWQKIKVDPNLEIE